jgi:hypothetical protein
LDAGGAQVLQRLLEQQAHWREADAVREGRQPAVDPDRDSLIRIGDGIRVYGSRAVDGKVVHLCKRLVDGVWINDLVAESRKRTDPSSPANVEPSRRQGPPGHPRKLRQ